MDWLIKLKDRVHRTFVDSRYTVPETGWWRMKNGGLIRISKMGDDHLLNTLKMLVRKAQALCSPGFAPRGDAMDAQLQMTWRDYTHPKFAELEAEYVKRELDGLDIYAAEIQKKAALG